MKQKGFAGLELLLIIAVILIIAGVGAYLYSKNAGNPFAKKNGNAPTKTADGQSTSPGGIPGGAQGGSSSAPAGSGTVVKLTQLGLQVTVPDSLKDLTYSVSGNNVYFSTRSLTALVPACAANSGTGAFQTVYRGSGNYQPPPNAADGGLIKQYDGYYYAYTLRQAPCAKNLSTTAQSLLDQQSQDFYTALSSVKAL